MAYKKVEKTTSKIGVTELPLVAIAPDPNQPRKHIDEEALKELAESIKKHGVLQPIMVQPDADGYKIVFGERRYRAALLAGLTNIPAVISNVLTPDETLELQVLENLQRKDINPMEESDAFHRLLTKKIATAKQLASKLGVSVKYVYDRLALQGCILEVRNAIRDGVFTIGTGKKFARLSLDDQRELFDDMDEDMDIDHAIRHRFTLKLTNASFDTEDIALNPGAGPCSKCQKRSGCNKLLFDDIVEESICFDKSCYYKKAEDHLEGVIKNLQSEGKEVVRLSRQWQSKDKNALGKSDWHELEIDTNDEDDQRAVHKYGVITESFSSEDIGNIVKLAERALYEDDEDEYGSESDADTALRRPATKIVGDYAHRSNLQAKLAKALFDSYTTVNAKDALRYFVENGITSLNDDDARLLASLLELVVKDEDGSPIEEPDEYQIAEASKELPIELLYKAAQFLMHYDDLRIDSIEDIEKANAISGLDATAVIEAYKSETGWSPISI